jgi:FtsZ-binding cell division protein ZapB
MTVRLPTPFERRVARTRMRQEEIDRLKTEVKERDDWCRQSRRHRDELQRANSELVINMRWWRDRCLRAERKLAAVAAVLASPVDVEEPRLRQEVAQAESGVMRVHQDDQADRG